MPSLTVALALLLALVMIVAGAFGAIAGGVVLGSDDRHLARLVGATALFGGLAMFIAGTGVGAEALL